MVFKAFILVCSLALSFVVATDTNAMETDLNIRIGSHAEFSIDGIEYSIRFVEMVEDSRCPEGVDCIWAGLARIKLEVLPSGGAMQEIILDTLADSDTATCGEMSIRLKSLEPYPKADAEIDPKSYTATLAVSRRKEN